MIPSVRLFASAGLLLAGAVAPGLNGQAAPPPAAAVGATAAAANDPAVKLDAVQVQAKSDDPGFDATGMGSYEQQLRDAPFSNDLISGEAVEDDPGTVEIMGELAAIASPSAVDLATGDSRLSLRGFPTPLMRNGFVTNGAPDMLNTTRTIVIQGALVPVLGRAAPGGIQDYLTARPRPKNARRFDYSLSSQRRQTASLELTGPAVPKKVWQRVAADWSRRTGPEQFAATETRSANGSVTWRHSAAASTLFAVDFQQVHATAAPGIPEYRVRNGDKIVGPYLPLAGFNALGPEAGVRRRTTAATVLFDGQPHPKIALRAGLEAWWRSLEQDRFTTSVYNLQTGRFDGIREPRHIEQPQHVRLAHLEAIGRFRALGLEHKLMLATSHAFGTYTREEHALPTEVRNALPASARLFDPDAPNYYRPPFSRGLYRRTIADREERARYSSVEISERVATADGRTVVTTGVRQDVVGLAIDDRRAGVARPHVKDKVDETTYHVGLNYQVRPSRLLVFASASTAFEPSTRVDARTGRIQGNETTRGYEGGFKARFADPQFELSVAGFSLFNDDISRRNPLYEDPILDANQTQPQLVTSGRETFRGGKFDARWRPLPQLSLSARGAYARAITTASPDLPEEVGRPLTRLPPYNASLAASYAFGKGKWQGVSLGATWVYVSSFTAYYEDRQRYRLEYPGYGLAGLSASRSFKHGKFTHGVVVAVRNLFDYDFETKHARLGAGREFSARYRLLY